MDEDGKNVQRLTDTPGYDGGAFFNADCTKIVWRASRPEARQGAGRLQGPARAGARAAHRSWSCTWPTRTARRPGRSPSSTRPRSRRSSTRTASASSSRRTTATRRAASSTSGRWTSTARTSSASPTRPASTASPCSRPTASGSRSRRNRATAPGKHDTNVFVARWVEDAKPATPDAEAAADRIEKDVTFLADPAREGRGIGTAGLEAVGRSTSRSASRRSA